MTTTITTKRHISEVLIRYDIIKLISEIKKIETNDHVSVNLCETLKEALGLINDVFSGGDIYGCYQNWVSLEVKLKKSIQYINLMMASETITKHHSAFLMANCLTIKDSIQTIISPESR